jgi:hypothetical protein
VDPYGLVPVAVLGSRAVDVRRLTVGSLRLGHGGAAPLRELTRPIADVNGDGFGDRTAVFSALDASLAPADHTGRPVEVEACLSGRSRDGHFISCDRVVVVWP